MQARNAQGSAAGWAWQPVDSFRDDCDLYRRLKAADRSLSTAYRGELEYFVLSRSAHSPMWRAEREFLGLYLGISLPRWTTRVAFREAGDGQHCEYGIVNLRPAKGVNVQLPEIADGVLPVPTVLKTQGYKFPVTSDCMKLYGPMWWPSPGGAMAAAVPTGVPWCRVEAELGGSCAEAALFVCTMILASRGVAVSGCFEFDIRGKVRDSYQPIAIGGMDVPELVRALKRTPGADCEIIKPPGTDDKGLAKCIARHLGQGLPVIAIVDATVLTSVYPEDYRNDMRSHAIVIIGSRAPGVNEEGFSFCFHCSSYLPYLCVGSSELFQAMRAAWTGATLIIPRASSGKPIA